jgi:hypothetical protein
MANKPILFIGIGSSGLYTLEQLQNFYYENTGKNKPSWAEYLYIETNKENQPSITALKSEINRVYISLAEMETMIKELRAEGGSNLEWLPPEDHVLDAGLGAGGIPSCGRLALWGSNREGNNIRNVINNIKYIHTKVAGPSAKDTDGSEPAVFITGSLTGGTGTGIFIDLAYLIRSEIPGIKEIYSLLLTPPESSVINGAEIIYLNSLGGIKALAHYNEVANKYIIPCSNNQEILEPPFELNQFISQSYNDATPQINSLSGLYKMAGLYLFLNMVGLRAKRFERLVDAKGNLQIGKYGTFGISAIQYPKAQIQEYLSLNLSSSLLERWIDSGYYFQANQKIPIDNTQITRSVTKRFDEILREAFDTLNASGGTNLSNNITKEAVAINKGEKGDKPDYLYDLFSPANAEGYYNFLSNNLAIATDYIIQEVNNFIIQDFNRYENLYYTKAQLVALADAIKRVLDYWKNLGISAYASKWEDLLGKQQVPWMLTNLHKYIGEQNNILRERMLSTLDMLKMHHFIKKMIDLRKNILEGEVPLGTATLSTRVELPTINKINTLIKELERTIGLRDDIEREARFKSLQKRKSEIESDMNDTSVPILRIFPANTFENEVRQANERYRNESNKTFPSKETLIGDKNLWDYLNQTDINMHRILYHDCILRFKEELDNYNSVKDYDVSEFVKRNPQNAAIFAGKARSYMLPIRKKTLKTSQNIPRVVLGSDKTVIENVIRLLQAENFQEFLNDTDHIKEISELKNLMVFYIEQGNFEPLEDISYMSKIKALDLEYPTKLRGMTTEKWNNFRNPYLN